MSQPSRHSPEAILRGYFHAKDENRPHLLEGVFAVDAELEVINNATNIAFPAFTHGREAIGEVMVRRFAQTYENIYSYYLASPPGEVARFSCAWLVGMTEKDGKAVRVGCGRYDWTFQTEPPHLANHLVITIDAMQALHPGHAERVFAWLELLNYPWSSAAEAATLAPSLELLAPVLEYLGRT